jgi:acetoin:2,6-dichlorophenolindophenol oxidoreductase subunit beta
MSSQRKLKYGLAINEALKQLMRSDPSVILIGQGVKSPWYVGNTCTDLVSEFGEDRVIDTPVSENAMTGAAVGAALAGMKAIVVHPRVDFVLYAFDPIVNQAANWHYMSGGNASAPAVFWLIVNRGGEQAAQHSQALHALFSHIPGLKVVAPSTPADAKGLLIAAVNDPDPVIYIDDRWLYAQEEEVDETMTAFPLGKAVIRRSGSQISLISSSYTSLLCRRAAESLASEGIDAEVVDLLTLKPYDKECVLQSVSKTGRAVIVDGGWRSFGYAAEISAYITENLFGTLHAAVQRVCLPDAPAPASRTLEEAYYITEEKIIQSVKSIINHKR